ncbi:MAG: hypothetical protein GKR90_21245 [Pseudomonadales bacterium]|nr:hypothetical protein [Pseudomonadales bacterium]
MSYILDALKKSQAEQSRDTIALSQQVSRKPRLFVHAALTIALIINVIFFATYWYDEDTPTEAKTEIAAPVEQQPRPETSSKEPVSVSAVPTEPPDESIPEPVTQPKPVETILVDALSETERVLYDGFSFTSHIYTDVKGLRAIVIDGQRVEIGDSFKGLKIHDITETGVVFEENRRGEQRRVAVNPFE